MMEYNYFLFRLIQNYLLFSQIEFIRYSSHYVHTYLFRHFNNACMSICNIQYIATCAIFNSKGIQPVAKTHIIQRKANYYSVAF